MVTRIGLCNLALLLIREFQRRRQPSLRLTDACLDCVAHRLASTHPFGSSRLVGVEQNPGPPRAYCSDLENPFKGKSFVLHFSATCSAQLRLVFAQLGGVELPVERLDASVYAVVIDDRVADSAAVKPYVPESARARRLLAGAALNSAAKVAAAFVAGASAPVADTSLQKLRERAAELRVEVWSLGMFKRRLDQVSESSYSTRADLPRCNMPRIIIEDVAGKYRPTCEEFPMAAPNCITSAARTGINNLNAADSARSNHWSLQRHTVPTFDWEYFGSGHAFTTDATHRTAAEYAQSRERKKRVSDAHNARWDSIIAGRPSPPVSPRSMPIKPVAAAAASSRHEVYCEICEFKFQCSESDHYKTPLHQQRYCDPARWKCREELDKVKAEEARVAAFIAPFTLPPGLTADEIAKRKALDLKVVNEVLAKTEARFLLFQRTRADRVAALAAGQKWVAPRGYVDSLKQDHSLHTALRIAREAEVAATTVDASPVALDNVSMLVVAEPSVRMEVLTARSNSSSRATKRPASPSPDEGDAATIDVPAPLLVGIELNPGPSSSSSSSETGRTSHSLSFEAEQAFASLRVLAIGMAFANPEYAATGKDKQNYEFAARAGRDRERLLELLKLHPHWDIQTMNQDEQSSDCEPRAHVQARFCSRGVKAAFKAGQFRVDDGPYAFVILDYFAFCRRAPVAYSSFCREVIPFLQAKGLVTQATLFIMPKTTVGERSDYWCKSTLQAHLTILEHSELTAQDHPLWQATRTLSKEELLHAEDDFKLLEKDNPFIVYRFDCPVQIVEAEAPQTDQESCELQLACTQPPPAAPLVGVELNPGPPTATKIDPAAAEDEDDFVRLWSDLIYQRHSSHSFDRHALLAEGLDMWIEFVRRRSSSTPAAYEPRLVPCKTAPSLLCVRDSVHLPNLQGAFPTKSVASGAVLSTYQARVMRTKDYHDCPIAFGTAYDPSGICSLRGLNDKDKYLLVGLATTPAAHLNHSTQSATVKFSVHRESVAAPRLTSDGKVAKLGRVLSDFVTVVALRGMSTEDEAELNYGPDFFTKQPHSCDYCLLKDDASTELGDFLKCSVAHCLPHRGMHAACAELRLGSQERGPCDFHSTRSPALKLQPDYSHASRDVFSTDPRLLSQKRNVERWLLQNHDRIGLQRYHAVTVERKVPSQQVDIKFSSLVPNTLGVFLKKKSSPAERVCLYPGYLLYEELADELAKHCYCPTMVRVPALDYLVDDQVAHLMGLKEEECYDASAKTSAKWTVRMTLVGDPTCAGPIVNSPLGFAKVKANCELHCDADKVASHLWRVGNRFRVDSSLIAVRRVGSVHNWKDELMLPYEPSDSSKSLPAEFGFWNRLKQLEEHCERCFLMESKSTNPLLLCSHVEGGDYCRTARHANCLGEVNEVANWLCSCHRKGRGLPQTLASLRAAAEGTPPPPSQSPAAIPSSTSTALSTKKLLPQLDQSTRPTVRPSLSLAVPAMDILTSCCSKFVDRIRGRMQEGQKWLLLPTCDNAFLVAHELRRSNTHLSSTLRVSSS